mgnify:FL=1
MYTELDKVKIGWQIVNRTIVTVIKRDETQEDQTTMRRVPRAVKHQDQQQIDLPIEWQIPILKSERIELIK